MFGSPGFRLLCLVALSLSLIGCVRGCTSSRPPIHIVPNMDWQPKGLPQSESGFFYNGSMMRLPVPGTVARGQLREDTAFFTGRDADGEFVQDGPPAATDEVARRGAERYEIYCRPCHDKRGNGRGIMYEKGGVPTASFHDERLLAMPDGEIFETITIGKGLMSGYGYPIPAEDRWAIVTHVRLLQEENLARVAATR